MDCQKRNTFDHILEVIPTGQLVTTSWVEKRMKCSHEITLQNLRQLKTDGKIKQVKVAGGRDVNWEQIM
jgi:ribosomal protein S25